MDRFSSFSFLITISYCLAFPGTAFGLDGHLRAEGAELVLRLEDGRTLRREALIGATLVMAGPRSATEVKIDGIDEDATATGGPILLYRLSVSAPDRLSWGEFCEADARGRRAGFPMPDGSGGFAFTCTSGAEGKCVLMGYRPWEQREGVPLRDLHRACVHMLRADYGGDDRPMTRNGTRINIYDRFGIQKPDKAEGMRFEAAWGANGAVCVSHPRIADNVTLEELAERYPHLKGRLGPHACREDAMRSDSRAVLFNESLVTWRTVR
jgi:hypothetical protein